MLTVEILIILVLILINGFFALTELAVVSARPIRLQHLAERGNPGARAALWLAEDPGRFLSAVQIAITLVGILAGAFGGARLSGRLAEYLAGIPLFADIADGLALALVVGAITYLSLVIGELVPKRLALRHPEALACWVALPVKAVARLAAPLVVVLDVSSRLVLRLLGVSAPEASTVSDEEIQLLLREAAEAGVVEPAEQAMITNVMRLADRPVTGIMTPRPDIEWVDIRQGAEQNREQLRRTSYSRLLVCDGGIDEVLGVVQAKDMLNRGLAGAPLDLTACLRQPPAVPEGASALAVMEELKTSPVHMALVVDEYGSIVGLVTTADILKVIIGELAEHGALPEDRFVAEPDGSWRVDGGLAVDELRELIDVPGLEAGEGYHTLAGWILDRLGEVPAAGDVLQWQGYSFEIVEMDGHRIETVRIVPPAPEPEQ